MLEPIHIGDEYVISTRNTCVLLLHILFLNFSVFTFEEIIFMNILRIKELNKSISFHQTNTQGRINVKIYYISRVLIMTIGYLGIAKIVLDLSIELEGVK